MIRYRRKQIVRTKAPIGSGSPLQQTLLKLPKGYMSAHPGAPGFRHGARRITKGVRYTLVSFIQN